MKNGKRYIKTPAERKEITLNICKAIGITGLVISTMVFPGVAVIARLFEEETGYKGRRARRAFHTLRKDGAIKVLRKSNGIKIFLTDKGKKRFEKLKVKALRIIRPLKWDGRWRMVMFDVPEQVRWARNSIRIILKRLGFVAIQKSVFIQPYPCEEIIDHLRAHYKLRPGELYIFEARVLEGEKTLRKHFKI